MKKKKKKKKNKSLNVGMEIITIFKIFLEYLYSFDY